MKGKRNMAKPFQVTPFSIEKIKRLKLKATKLSLKELKEAYEQNKAESDRCLETNKLLSSLIKERRKKHG